MIKTGESRPRIQVWHQESLVDEGKEVWMLVDRAIKRGDWMLHNQTCEHQEDAGHDRYKTHLWIITHIPTGRAVAMFGDGTPRDDFRRGLRALRFYAAKRPYPSRSTRAMKNIILYNVRRFDVMNLKRFKR